MCETGMAILGYLFYPRAFSDSVFFFLEEELHVLHRQNPKYYFVRVLMSQLLLLEVYWGNKQI
jgi:CTP:phosphocholine cytidylyltransferase-like protein